MLAYFAGSRTDMTAALNASKSGRFFFRMPTMISVSFRKIRELSTMGHTLFEHPQLNWKKLEIKVPKVSYSS
jgi:hypothetical protein